MKARAGAQSNSGPETALSADPARPSRRGAAFGIIVAVIAAAFVWPILVGLYVFVTH